jgi:hypothetical protein
MHLGYQTFWYERDYSQQNKDQPSRERNIDKAAIVPRVNATLFRERRELGNCDRSVALRYPCGDFDVAGLGCRRFFEVFFAARVSQDGPAKTFAIVTRLSRKRHGRIRFRWI